MDFFLKDIFVNSFIITIESVMRVLSFKRNGSIFDTAAYA